MAKISKADLIGLTNSEIKLCFTTEDISKMPKAIREYVEEGKETYTMGNRINRIENLMMQIIVDRFIKGELDSVDIGIIKAKERYKTLSEIESLVGRIRTKHKTILRVLQFTETEMNVALKNANLNEDTSIHRRRS
jgi:hypothetical protein